jgi:ABC-2 type transport system ATP-binding protein
MAAIVQTHDLTKRYGSTLALDHLNLEIPEGAVYGFIGPNGAGKTTTMRILTGLLRASGGEAWIAGHEVSRDPRAVRSLVGWMPDTFGVYDNMKSWEYLDFFAASYGLPETRRRQLIGELLDLVDLSHKRDDYVMGLSRGMKQRLSLARTMAHDPKLLILDEPASGLDPRARIELRELLKELRSLGKTIMISSHILTELAEMCTHIGIVETGHLLVSGEVGDVLRSLQPHKIVEVRVLGDPARAVDLLRPLPGVRDVRLLDAVAQQPEAVQQALEPDEPAQVAARQALPTPDELEQVDREAAGLPWVEQAVAQPLLTGARSLLIDYAGDLHGLSGLLKVLAGADVPVIHFAEQASDLEDIFMQVTHGTTQ